MYACAGDSNAVPRQQAVQSPQQELAARPEFEVEHLQTLKAIHPNPRISPFNSNLT